MAGSIRPGTLTPVGGRGFAFDRAFAQRGSPPGPTGMLRDEAPSPLGAKLAPQATVGPSVAPRRVTADGEARPLTAGEMALARSIFAGSVDYGRVKIHNHEYLPFGLQPNDTAMTPNGEMYFNPSRFQEDFSTSEFSDAHWFMHEMVHVWQHQLGYPVFWRGAVRIGLGYEYTLEPDKRLRDYNMEAQGNLLSDYWAVSTRPNPPRMWERKHVDDLPLFRTVLADFIADPANRHNLPK